LLLIRHGEIVRPSTSNFDLAQLSPAGAEQMRSLAREWTHGKPDRVYCSTLPRSAESALILAETWDASVRVLEDLREWSPTVEDISQEEYLAREEACWKDHDLEYDTGESINEAMQRVVGAMGRIATEVPEGTTAVVGHGMVFTMFLASIRGEKPDIEYKRKIRNAATAVVEHEKADFRLVRGFF